MKLVIFGAAGKTGRQLVKQALVQGFTVTAFVRPGEKLGAESERLIIRQGDVLNQADVNQAVATQDVVISVLGVKAYQKPVGTPGIKAIIAAMQNYGVKRLIVQSAYGAADTNRNLYTKGIWLGLRPQMTDKNQMEELIHASGLDWTIVRPVKLTRGGRSGYYQTGTDLKPPATALVSRGDVADFELKLANSADFLRQAVTIGPK